MPKPAHLRLRKTLAEIAAWNDESGPNQLIAGSKQLGIITSGVSFQHVREAAPEASVLKLGMTYPLPVGAHARLCRRASSAAWSSKRAIRIWWRRAHSGHRGRGQAGDLPLRRTEL
jgi:hypothetical protein